MLCFNSLETLFTIVDKINHSDILYILPQFPLTTMVKLFRDFTIKLNKPVIQLFIKPRIEEIDLYSRFRAGSSNLVVSYLQCTNDTFILADPTLVNMLSIKAIQRGLSLLWDFRSVSIRSLL